MVPRLLHAAVLAAFVLVVSPAAADHQASTLPPPSPQFRPAAGWIVRHPTRSEQPDTSASMMIAVTTDDVAVLHPFAPFVGFKRLRQRGAIIWATTIGRVATSPFRPFPRASWPLRFSSFRIDRSWEGQPAPNIQQRLRAVLVRGWNLDVRVYFGTQHPSQPSLAAVQAELNRLRLPAP